MPKFEFRTGIYEGDAVGNIPNGKGKATFDNDGFYEGEFLDGDFKDGVKKYEYTDEDYKNAGGDARFGSK